MFSLSAQRIVGPSKKRALTPTPNRDGLAVEDITIADALKVWVTLPDILESGTCTPKMVRAVAVHFQANRVLM